MSALVDPVPAASAAAGRGPLPRQLSALVRLAIPVVIARSGLMAMASVDLLMVGHYAAADLAWASLGAMAAGPLIGVLVGLLMGTMVTTALALGGGRAAAAGAAWRRSVPYGLAIGVAMAVACLFGEAFFRATGQGDGLAVGGGAVLAILGLGLPGIALYITSAFWLEAIGRPGPGMVLMIVGNVLNVGLNWVLVYGHLGLPAMGAEGSAWATTTMRWIMGLSLLAAIWWLPDRARWGVRGRSRTDTHTGTGTGTDTGTGTRTGRAADGGPGTGWRDQRRQGYAAAVSIGCESVSFTILALMAGWAGAIAVGAFSVALTIMAVVFMVALGVATATAAQVGIAWGSGDRAGARRAGWLGLGLDSVLMAVFAVGMLAAPDLLAAAFTSDPEVIRLAAAMIAVAAFAMVLDGGQTVMAHAVRGTGDTWVPSVLQATVYVGIMPVLAWALAYGLDRGPTGLMEAIILASVLALAGQSWRFAWLIRHRRPGA
jgi:MATE family multidrug resistance protein